MGILGCMLVRGPWIHMQPVLIISNLEKIINFNLGSTAAWTQLLFPIWYLRRCLSPNTYPSEFPHACQIGSSGRVHTIAAAIFKWMGLSAQGKQGTPLHPHLGKHGPCTGIRLCTQCEQGLILFTWITTESILRTFFSCNDSLFLA